MLTQILTVTHNRRKMKSGTKRVLHYNNLPLRHVEKNILLKGWC